ncbi:UDP-N-acetylmuramoyl-L-alanyl-D-glutamate--2,6-diaminopimelate ligase [Candidatus Calescamantes bacterium]|nr:UDP-N-acetylmuramoyl-L-alanyl-D-glutamate--2,6-diaminopimelate ligase [Candidatus Calescamantes bacterium]
MNLRGLIKGLKIKSIRGELDVDIKGVVEDSRLVKPGFLFVCIKGREFNGHKFIFQALEKGARAIAGEEEMPQLPGITWIRVENTRRFLSFVAHRFFGEPGKSMKIMGITGTNGKTTTSYLIYRIMERAGYGVGRIGSIWYEWKGRRLPASLTTPQSLNLFSLLSEMLQDGVKEVVMEVSSHSLSLHRVDALRFSWAIFTNLTPDHLDFHGDMEEYFRAKLKLLDLLKEKGKVFVNMDDPKFSRIPLLTRKEVITFGEKTEAHYRIMEWESNWEGVEMLISAKGEKKRIFLPFPGKFNLYNAVAAVAWAREEEISWKVITETLANMEPVPGRFEVLKNGEIRVVVDYAHTPDALNRLLENVRELTPGRVITVFGCGGERDREKRPLMGKVAEVWSDWVIVTSDNPRREDPELIIRDILNGMEGKNHEVLIDREEAIRKAIGMAEEGDTVVIAGKGHENYQIWGETIIPFEDKLVAENFLKERRKLKV